MVNDTLCPSQIQTMIGKWLSGVYSHFLAGDYFRRKVPLRASQGVRSVPFNMFPPLLILLNGM